MTQPPFTYFVSLECSLCHRQFDPHQVQTYCPDCKVPLVSNYDLERARRELGKDDVQRGHGMWRWHALLPMYSPQNIVSLGEGDTPLLPLRRLGRNLGLPGLSLKDEGLNPTGGGTGLVGIWKAFQELEQLGWLPSAARPRMVSVQAAGCAPVVRAWQVGDQTCEFWQGAQTIASGLRVPKSFADRLILQTISASGGTAVAVTDEEIRQAQQQLAAQEGLFVAPEGAATLAGLIRLQTEGWIKPEQRILLLNTGMGLKYIN